jgi:endonuclease III-like uncharacterized protein
MDFSRARAAAAFIIIHHIIKKKPKRKAQWWMKKLYVNRIQCGVKLLEDMRYEAVEDTIKNFTRMTTIETEALKIINRATGEENGHTISRSDFSNGMIRHNIKIFSNWRLIYKPAIPFSSIKTIHFTNSSRSL